MRSVFKCWVTYLVVGMVLGAGLTKWLWPTTVENTIVQERQVPVPVEVDCPEPEIDFQPIITVMAEKFAEITRTHALLQKKLMDIENRIVGQGDRCLEVVYARREEKEEALQAQSCAAYRTVERGECDY